MAPQGTHRLPKTLRSPDGQDSVGHPSPFWSRRHRKGTANIAVRVIAVATILAGLNAGCIEPDAPSIDAFNGTDEVVTLTIAVAGVGGSETRALGSGGSTTLTDGRDECTNVILEVSYRGGKPLDTFEGQLCQGDTLRIEDDGVSLDEG